jgi:hypothetical protein
MFPQPPQKKEKEGRPKGERETTPEHKHRHGPEPIQPLFTGPDFF